MTAARLLRYVGTAALGLVVLAVAVPWPGPVDASDDPTISAVQYNREIVRILDRKCVACHSKGGQAMSLETYRDAKDWGRSIREEMLEHRMPPWPAATGLRPLTNDPSLTARDVALLLSWVDGGLPRGDAEDLPPAITPAAWKRGDPDVVLSLPPQTVKTDGVTVVRTVRLAAKDAPARWLRAFDIVAGERSALRAAFLSLDSADGSRQWLGTWTPWYSTSTPDHAAFALPANATLSVELHYNAWDEPVRTVTDTTRLGIYTVAAAPRDALRPLRVVTSSARATPAGRRLQGDVVLTTDAFVWGLRPRLHRAGTAVNGSLEVIATRPDGSVEPLLWLKENGPDWQYAYELSDPVDLPRGSRIRLVAYATGPGANDAVADVDSTWYAAPPAGPSRETASLAGSPAAEPRR